MQSGASLIKIITLIAITLSLSACSKGPEDTIQLATQGLLSGALSEDGNQAAIGSIHHGGSLWDLHNKERLYAWNHAKGSLSSIRAASISGNGKLAVTCVEDTMVLWDTQSGKAMQFWQAPDRILAIKLNAKGDRALAGLRNGKVIFFDMNRGTSIFNFDHQAEVRMVDLNYDGSTGISGSDDKTAKVLDLVKGKEVRSLTLNNHIKTVALSPSGSLAFTSSQREDTEIWETLTGKVVFKFANRYTNYTSAAFTEDEQYLSAGTFQGKISRWQIATGKETQTWQAKPRQAYGGANSKAILDIIDLSSEIVALTSDGQMQRFIP